MNLYTVKYKRYDGVKELRVVAATPLKALERSKALIKKREYGDKEVLSVEKDHEVDGIAK